MSWIYTMWSLVVLVVVIGVGLTLFRARRRHTSAAPSAALRTAFLIATATSGAVLLNIAVKVNDIVPNVTAVDIAALAITGILTGFFLALSLTGGHSTGVKN